MEENFPGLFDEAPAEPVAAAASSQQQPGSTRKRSRTEIEPEPVEESVEVKKTPSRPSRASQAAAAVEVETEPPVVESKLTYNEKNALRTIITKLSKHPLAEPFLYPVDRKEYPEYYHHIKRPMDLETARNNLSDYTSLYDALTDLRLIWANCRQFNEEGSEIIAATYEMGEALEELVEEKFGPEYVVRVKKETQKTPSKRTKSAASTASTAATATSSTPKEKEHHHSVKEEKSVKMAVDKDDQEVDEEVHTTSTTSGRVRGKKRVSEAHSTESTATALPVLSVGDIKILLREMTACEFSAPFIDPVDPSTAPGYLKVVSTPMALDTMRGHVRAGLYTDN
eukprot:gene27551-34284_t